MNKVINQYQMTRFMFLSDQYALASAWNVPLGGRIAARTTEAWRTILLKWRMYREVDIWDVVCVLAKNDYQLGTEAYEIMIDKRFDDLSLDMAKRYSRRALQRLQPHLENGVVAGNVDVDALLSETLNSDIAALDLPDEQEGAVSEENAEAVGDAAAVREQEELEEIYSEFGGYAYEQAREDGLALPPERAQFFGGQILI